MAKRVSNGQTNSKIKKSLYFRINNLSFKIISTIIFLLSALGILLYFSVLSSVSNFASKNIKENLEWAANDVYNICDKGFDELLKSGFAYDEKTLKIKTGLTLGVIEDFVIENDFDCIVYLKYNKRIIYYTELDFEPSEVLKQLMHENLVFNFEIKSKKYFTYYFQYEPWDWNIIILKDKEDYSNLINNVRLSYVLTGIIVLFLAIALILFLNNSVKNPITKIINSIKKDEPPSYHGTKEFEFLSNSIKEMMNHIYEQAEWINKVFSTIGALLIVMDTTGKLFMFNKTVEDLTGYSSKKEKGKYIWDLFVPEKHILYIKGLFKNLNDHNFPISFEGGILTKSGTEITIFWTDTIIVDKENHVQWVVATGIDITKRKLAEELLRESEKKYRLLVDTMNEGVVVQDRSGIITYANDKFCKIIGYKYEDTIDQPTERFLDNKNKNILKRELEKRKKNINDLFEITWTSNDNTKIDTIVSPMSIFDNDNNYKGYFGVVADITERKKLEEELMKAHKLESIGVLAGGIAHDFNNILTGIIGNINLAKIYLDKDNNVYELLLEAEKVSFRAKDLTQQLLTFSKGGAPVKKTDSITELIKDTTIFALRGSNIKCDFSILKGLWLSEFDSGQISQVINNIVLNAKQAMLKGGNIEVSTENITIKDEDQFPLKNGKYILIAIKDHGVGISDENLPKIFDPYFTTKEKGVGLGLASSYSIINRHGGYIKVNSKLGEGTTMLIYLPAKEKKRLKKEKPGKKIIELKGNGKVLLMDDEEIILKTIGNMLEHIGFEVEKAKNGEEAVSLYQLSLENNNPFDIVITDLTIPGGMGGKETVDKLLNIDPNVKVIVSSGYSNNDVMSNYKKYGFKGVIVKPYNIEKLNEALNTVLNK